MHKTRLLQSDGRGIDIVEKQKVSLAVNFHVESVRGTFCTEWRCSDRVIADPLCVEEEFIHNRGLADARFAEDDDIDCWD